MDAVTDHAETILQALHLLGPDPVDDDAELHEGQLHGYEALRLLVAERDRWRSVACNVKDGTAAAEAEHEELLKSLRDIVCIYDSPVGGPVEVMQVMVGIARSALIADSSRRIPTGDGCAQDV